MPAIKIIDSMCDARFGLHLLLKWVRVRQDFSLAEGVRAMAEPLHSERALKEMTINMLEVERERDKGLRSGN